MEILARWSQAALLPAMLSLFCLLVVSVSPAGAWNQASESCLKQALHHGSDPSGDVFLCLAGLLEPPFDQESAARWNGEPDQEEAALIGLSALRTLAGQDLFKAGPALLEQINQNRARFIPLIEAASGTGNLDVAEADLRRELESGSNVESHLGLSVISFLRNQDGQAFSNLYLAASIAEPGSQSYQETQWLLAGLHAITGNFAAAAGTLRAVAPMAPPDAELLFSALASALDGMGGNTQAAEEGLKRLIARAELSQVFGVGDDRLAAAGMLALNGRLQEVGTFLGADRVRLEELGRIEEVQELDILIGLAQALADDFDPLVESLTAKGQTSETDLAMFSALDGLFVGEYGRAAEGFARFRALSGDETVALLEGLMHELDGRLVRAGELYGQYQLGFGPNSLSRWRLGHLGSLALAARQVSDAGSSEDTADTSNADQANNVAGEDAIDEDPAENSTIAAELNIDVAEEFVTETDTVVIEGTIQGHSRAAVLSLDFAEQEIGEDGGFRIEDYLFIDEERTATLVLEDGDQRIELSIALKRVAPQPKVAKLRRPNPRVIEATANEHAVAIIIGIESYDYAPDALYASRDAAMFYDYARRALGVPEEGIVLLRDGEADKRGILQMLRRDLPRRVKKDQSDVFLFFAGHGLATADGSSAYLLPASADPELLRDTAIDRDELIKEIERLGPRHLTVFIDSCYSGRGRDGAALMPNSRGLRVVRKEVEATTAMTMFTAASNDQISIGLDQVKQGAFSYALMIGLEGEADVDGNREITASELDRWLKERVGTLAPNQTPDFSGSGDHVVARY